jgi:hypothetical protein
MSITREVHADGWCVRFDLSRQVLRLEVPEAPEEHRHGGRPPSPLLSPVLPFSAVGPVSAAVLLLKAKQFDDGLHAAVEMAAQRGAGHFAGRHISPGDTVETETDSARKQLHVPGTDHRFAAQTVGQLSRHVRVHQGG